MARAAEESGYDSIWLGDHLLYRGDGREERGPWEVWTLLAALAGVTSEGIEGVIIGRALYDGRIDPAAALALVAR